MPNMKESMLKKIPDHRNWSACLFAISPMANTNMRHAPDKATTVKSRIFKYFVVRTGNTPNTNAAGASQKAWASSFFVMELVFIAVKGKRLSRQPHKSLDCGPEYIAREDQRAPRKVVQHPRNKWTETLLIQPSVRFDSDSCASVAH